jgi:hypothetical protein
MPLTAKMGFQKPGNFEFLMRNLHIELDIAGGFALMIKCLRT